MKGNVTHERSLRLNDVRIFPAYVPRNKLYEIFVRGKVQEVQSRKLLFPLEVVLSTCEAVLTIKFITKAKSNQL